MLGLDMVRKEEVIGKQETQAIGESCSINQDYKEKISDKTRGHACCQESKKEVEDIFNALTLKFSY